VLCSKSLDETSEAAKNYELILKKKVFVNSISVVIIMRSQLWLYHQQLQQATTDIMPRNHSIIACSHHISMGVILCTHLVRGESHIEHNANW